MPTGVYIRTSRHRAILSKARTGKKASKETREKIRKNHARQWAGKRNEETAHWKGDSVGYTGLHDWVRREKGSPMSCERCAKSGGNSHNYHWANISGKYLRDLDDFMRLCVSCHKLFDLGKIEIKGVKRYDSQQFAR